MVTLAARPASRPRPGGRAGLGVDLALALVAAALAAALRLPALLDVPLITNETEEIALALSIARGERLPLVNVSDFLGAWNAYLTAAAFRLVGFDLLVARGVTLALGTLTVAITYWLARELRLAPLAAAFAAGLLAVSAVHVLVGSHVAYSNCTEAFYTTLALALAARAARRGTDWLLVPTGLVAGLAAQTHPTAALPLIGLALYAAWQARAHRWWRGIWPPLAVAAFLVAYSPVLVYNAQHGLEEPETVNESRHSVARDVFANTPYLPNLAAELNLVARDLASSFASSDGAASDPQVIVAGLLGLAGLAWAARAGAGRALLVLAAGAGLLLLPAVSDNFEVLLDSRTLLPSMPPLVVAEAGLLAALAGAILRPVPTAGAARVGVLLALAAVAAWLLIGPIARLAAYEGQVGTPAHVTALRALAGRLDGARGPGQPVLLDRTLSANNNPRDFPSQVRRGRVLQLLLDLRGVPTAFVSTKADSLCYALAQDANQGGLLALLPQTPPPARLDELPGLGDTPEAPSERLRVYRGATDASFGCPAG